MTRKVVCAGAQSINYLGPVVKPRDDKKDVIDITWVPWSSHGMTRKVVCAGAQSINYLGPAVKPRDDKFLSFLFCSLFKKKERCVILGMTRMLE